jgi:hypothetical protein
MMAIFYFIWFMALIYSAVKVDTDVEALSYCGKWRRNLFFVHLFFLGSSVLLALAVIVKDAFLIR